MTEFLKGNVYVRFVGLFFQQTIGIPMGTNCAPLLNYLFIISYDNYLLVRLIDAAIQTLQKKIARKFNLSYYYTDELIS